MSTKTFNRTAYPDQLKNQIGEFVKMHLPYPESTVAEIDKYTVAKVFKTDPALVFRVAKQNGIELKKPEKELNPKHEVYIKFIQNHSHMTCSEIAEEVGESYHYIKGLCNRFNLSVAEGKPYNRRDIQQPEEVNGFFNPSARWNWLI